MQLQQIILAAMDSLPPATTVQRIGQTGGCIVSTRDMRSLIRSGHVAEVEREEPPVIGFSLTLLGSNEAERIRQESGAIRKPEMAATIPTVALRDRVTRDELLRACRSGKSIGWMRMKFDCGRVGLESLIEEYEIWEEIAEAGQASQATEAVIPKEEGKKVGSSWKLDKDKVYEAFAAGRGAKHSDRVKLAEEFVCHPATIGHHFKQWTKKGGGVAVIPDTSLTETAQDKDQQIVESEVDFLESIDKLIAAKKEEDRLTEEVSKLKAKLAELSKPRNIIILLDDQGAVESESPPPDYELSRGDEWAETVVLDGRRQVVVWQCITAVRDRERGTICVLRPIRRNAQTEKVVA